MAEKYVSATIPPINSECPFSYSSSGREMKMTEGTEGVPSEGTDTVGSEPTEPLTSKYCLGISPEVIGSLSFKCEPGLIAGGVGGDEWSDESYDSLDPSDPLEEIVLGSGTGGSGSEPGGYQRLVPPGTEPDPSEGSMSKVKRYFQNLSTRFRCS